MNVFVSRFIIRNKSQFRGCKETSPVSFGSPYWALNCLWPRNTAIPSSKDIYISFVGTTTFSVLQDQKILSLLNRHFSDLIKMVSLLNTIVCCLIYNFLNSFFRCYVLDTHVKSHNIYLEVD